ncbi:hypothetical protein PVAP13_6KG288218 [Panicum virgatum]|uniref:Uncharacterized protein n=1 Tax=Panicum virgatum TaxID=38727 RepID=A0A8T0RHH2_PANVG|nr:hypothetical protein PVAP13_6KG288218 [Panicum virgatum]
MHRIFGSFSLLYVIHTPPLPQRVTPTKPAAGDFPGSPGGALVDKRGTHKCGVCRCACGRRKLPFASSSRRRAKATGIIQKKKGGDLLGPGRSSPGDRKCHNVLCAAGR